jgi:hypothetical protein
MKNCVYKLTPKDFEQESIDSIMNWYSSIKIFLNQLPIAPNSERFNKEGIFGLLDKKITNDYYYKFYSLGDGLFLETNFLGELNIPDTMLEKVETPNQLIIDLAQLFSIERLKQLIATCE